MGFMKEGRAAKIEVYVPMINEIITSLGVNPNECYLRLVRVFHSNIIS